MQLNSLDKADVNNVTVLSQKGIKLIIDMAHLAIFSLMT